MADLSYVARLTRDLVRCASVTPIEAGALDLLQAELSALGFKCTRLPFGNGDGEGDDARVDNLFARLGKGKPHLAFAGHTDVVPAGDSQAWTYPPFAGEITPTHIYGRGAADMKGGVAAFIDATRRYLATNRLKGSLSFILTGDEEGKAVHGTVKMVDWLIEQKNKPGALPGTLPDACIVGEPTNPTCLGEMIKHGRRGSLNCDLSVYGVQGHVAYPHLAHNPLPALWAMLAPVNSTILDAGGDDFDPSTAEITHITVPPAARNVIPASASAHFNIRFHNAHTAASLSQWLEAHFAEMADKHGARYEARFTSNASPFITAPGPLTNIMRRAIRRHTGIMPSLSTSGGTSDARFIVRICPVAEFGLVNDTIHKIDEHVRLDDLDRLSDIYLDIITEFDNA